MNSREVEKKKETNYFELSEEVQGELLTSLNESNNFDEDVTSGQENENEVTSCKGSVHSNNNSILSELEITAVWYNSNKSGDDKELTSNRENIKKEFTHTTEQVAKNENLVENFNITQVKQAFREDQKPSNASCSTDEIGIGIDESRTVRFRNNLFVAIEELRIQRNLDLENEERIKTLMTEKHELERRKEEEISKNNALVQQHTQQEIDIKKQQEDRLLQYQEDKAKMTLAAECTEKELKILKDEVRALHLVKYNLEKKIKEQDRLIQLQNSARDSYESQISVLEQRSKKAFDQCTQLADLVEKTQTRFSAASRLHRKLMYTNEHQKCLLESYKRDLESKKFELVTLKATVAQKKDSSMRNADEERSRADALERELQMQNEVCQKSQNQLEDSRKENEKLMQSLKEAHKLLDRHVQSINKHCELEAVAHLELDEIKTECQTLNESLSKEQEERQVLEDTLKCRKTEWDKQKQALESHLEDLKKEYESLSEAHNSLEQLNSNWSEQNMEQKTKIESMLKEEEELKVRLAQAEERIQSEKERNEELKNTYSNEISSLKETLQQAKQDYKTETERAESLENQSTAMLQKIEDLEQELLRKEKEQVLNKKEVADTTSQTEDSFCEQVSSLSGELLRAKQNGTSQTERADYLEDQCTLLREKVNDLLRIVAQKEEEQIKDKETVSTAVQTDDASKITSDGPQNGNCSPFTEVNQVQDQNINEPLFKKSGKIQRREEGTCKDMDITLKQTKTDTAKRMTAATENKEENNNRKLICSNDQAKWQLKIDVDNKVDNEKTNDRETVWDKASSKEVNEKSSLGSNVSSQLRQEALKDQLSPISANTVAVTTALKMDVQDGAPPRKLLSNSKIFEESRNTAQINRGMNREITKDSTDVLKTDEPSMGLGRAMKGAESEPLSTCQDLGEDDCTETGEKPQTSETEGKKKDLTDMLGGTVKNTSCKVKSLGKRVRFNLEGNETSTTQAPNSSDEISSEETKMMFSDEEDEENKDRTIDEDVRQRISRIQNLLRSDRLRTNRKRKYPVV